MARRVIESRVEVPRAPARRGQADPLQPKPRGAGDGIGRGGVRGDGLERQRRREGVALHHTDVAEASSARRPASEAESVRAASANQSAASATRPAEAARSPSASAQSAAPSRPAARSALSCARRSTARYGAAPVRSRPSSPAPRVQRQKAVDSGLVSGRGERTGKQVHQLVGIRALLLGQPERIAARHPLRRDRLQPDHRLLHGISPPRPLRRARHRLQSLGRLREAGGILTGEVKVRVRRPGELPGVQRGRAGLGPHPRAGLSPASDRYSRNASAH